jgi:hypothetical protein
LTGVVGCHPIFRRHRPLVSVEGAFHRCQTLSQWNRT